MKKISSDSLSAILFEIEWSHKGIHHTDGYLAKSVNVWRDYLPHGIGEALSGKSAGQTLNFHLKPENGVPSRKKELVKDIHMSQFDKNFQKTADIYPYYGRFYPKGILKGVSNIFKCNCDPFRVVDLNDSVLKADLNHPLADTSVKLSASILNVMDKIDERGGTSNDWIQTVMGGPGMQARVNGAPTDFFSDNPFARSDTKPDGQFYAKPRLVTHIDNTAIQTIKDIYKNLLAPGTEILDLMSSWKSHLPDDYKFKKVTGLGLNHDELASNERLTDHVAHDLNDDPVLPFEGHSYDAVLCAVSVEYLIQPFEVFKEVARVLRPGGLFIVTFSNRWFPPKVVKIWQEIHEFERLGLVTEYFLSSGEYENIHTFSRRGLKRPVEDKYYMENPISDPVYYVYGTKKA